MCGSGIDTTGSLALIQLLVPKGAAPFAVTTAGVTVTAELDPLPEITRGSSAVDVAAALASLPSIGAGGVRVRARMENPDGGWLITFTPQCRSCIGDVELLSVVPVGAADVSEVASGKVLSSDQVDSVISFSTVVGSRYRGEWTTPRQLCVVIEQVSPLATLQDTKLGMSQPCKHRSLPLYNSVTQSWCYVLLGVGHRSTRAVHSPLRWADVHPRA